LYEAYLEEFKTKTCKRSIPRVAEPNLVGSSPFSARSYKYIHIYIYMLDKLNYPYLVSHMTVDSCMWKT